MVFRFPFCSKTPAIIWKLAFQLLPTTTTVSPPGPSCSKSAFSHSQDVHSLSAHSLILNLNSLIPSSFLLNQQSLTPALPRAESPFSQPSLPLANSAISHLRLCSARSAISHVCIRYTSAPAACRLILHYL